MKHVDQKGFTIIEMLVAVSVFVMITGGIVLLQRNMLTASKLISDGLTSQQQVRKLFKEFQAEARIMQASESGAYPITEAATSSFAFYSDYDHDGDVERVRYFYATTTNSINKGVIEPSGVGTTTYLASDERVSIKVNNISLRSTSSPLFMYYSSNFDGVATNTALASPVVITSIRHVSMGVWIVSSLKNATSTAVYFQTEVTPRNIKDNL